MAPQLNHTLVQVHDAEATASFLTEVLGLPPAYRYGPFLCVETSNAVSLDVIEFEPDVAIDTQHYAFLVTDQEFDEIFARITERGLTYWADPTTRQEGEINHREGGRGVYFHDPAGHLLEVLTQSYDSSLAATDG